MDDHEPTGRVFTRLEKRMAGMSRRDFETAVRTNAIRKLRRTVFAEAGVVAAAARDPATAHALEIEALMRALSRDRIAASASSAGIVHGLEFVVPPPKELIVCTSDPGVKGTRQDGYNLRVAPLPDDHLQIRHHVRVTSVARTLFDLASDLSFPHALATTDDARHNHLVRAEELDAVLDWGVGRAGVDAARKVFRLSDPRSESVLESISRAGMHEQGVPIPELQVKILTAKQEFVARVDFKWQLPVVGDPSGWKRFRRPGTDDVPLSVVKRYFARKHALIDLGFEFVTWTWDEAVDEPPLVAKRIFAALERAEAKIAAAARRARSRVPAPKPQQSVT